MPKKYNYAKISKIKKEEVRGGNPGPKVSSSPLELYSVHTTEDRIDRNYFVRAPSKRAAKSIIMKEGNGKVDFVTLLVDDFAEYIEEQYGVQLSEKELKDLKKKGAFYLYDEGT